MTRQDPRAAAQALRGGRSSVIALSVPDGVGGADGWLGLYLLQITAAARARGHDLLIASEVGDYPEAIMNIARSGRADGAVIMSVQPHDRRVEALADLEFPSASLGEPLDGSLLFVDYDFRRASALAIDYLVARGHTSLAYVCPRRQERRSGYLHVDRAIDGMVWAAKKRGVALAIHLPEDDPHADGSVFTALLEQHRSTGLIVTQRFSATDRLISVFAETRRPSEPNLDVVTFGASGLPGGAARTAAAINPLDTLARACIDALVDLLDERGSVSRVVSPIWRSLGLFKDDQRPFTRS